MFVICIYIYTYIIHIYIYIYIACTAGGTRQQSAGHTALSNANSSAGFCAPTLVYHHSVPLRRFRPPRALSAAQQPRPLRMTLLYLKSRAARQISKMYRRDAAGTSGAPPPRLPPRVISKQGAALQSIPTRRTCALPRAAPELRARAWEAAAGCEQEICRIASTSQFQRRLSRQIAQHCTSDERHRLGKPRPCRGGGAAPSPQGGKGGERGEIA